MVATLLCFCHFSSQHFGRPDHQERDGESFCSGASVDVGVPSPYCVVGDVLRHRQ